MASCLSIAVVNSRSGDRKLPAGGAGDWTRGLVHAKHALYHWATPPLQRFWAVNERTSGRRPESSRNHRPNAKYKASQVPLTEGAVPVFPEEISGLPPEFNPPSHDNRLGPKRHYIETSSLWDYIWESLVDPGNGNPLQCSCLENPRDGGAWWAAVYGVAQSRPQLKRFSSSSSSSRPRGSSNSWLWF